MIALRRLAGGFALVGALCTCGPPAAFFMNPQIAMIPLGEFEDYVVAVEVADAALRDEVLAMLRTSFDAWGLVELGESSRAGVHTVRVQLTDEPFDAGFITSVDARGQVPMASWFTLRLTNTADELVGRIRLSGTEAPVARWPAHVCEGVARFLKGTTLHPKP